MSIFFTGGAVRYGRYLRDSLWWIVLNERVSVLCVRTFTGTGIQGTRGRWGPHSGEEINQYLLLAFVLDREMSLCGCRCDLSSLSPVSPASVTASGSLSFLRRVRPRLVTVHQFLSRSKNNQGTFGSHL